MKLNTNKMTGTTYLHETLEQSNNLKITLYAKFLPNAASLFLHFSYEFSLYVLPEVGLPVYCETSLQYSLNYKYIFKPPASIA